MVFDPTHPSSNNGCWNYGETNCNIMIYPKPKDLVQSAANQKLFYHKKKGIDSKSTGYTPAKETKPIWYAWWLP